MLLTIGGLAKAGIFSTNVDADNQTLINHKCVYGARNRYFCQTRVGSCGLFLNMFFCHSLLSVKRNFHNSLISYSVVLL